MSEESLKNKEEESLKNIEGVYDPFSPAELRLYPLLSAEVEKQLKETQVDEEELTPAELEEFEKITPAELEEIEKEMAQEAGKIYGADNVKVSNEFIEIYRNFNVSDQKSNMGKLDKKNLYLLLLLCIDKHDDDDFMVINNYSSFEKEIIEIQEHQNKTETSVKELIELKKETDNEYISTLVIRDNNGNELPALYTKDEVRNLKLNSIIK